MANNLSDIVNVSINIESPAVDSASFDTLLIFGPPPAIDPDRELPDVGAYTDLTEVDDAGYVTVGDNADPVGIAARIAFSQNPKPATVFIAAQKKTEDGPEPAVETVMRALETAGWYVACSAGIGEAEYEPVAALIETQAKQFSYTFLSQYDPVGAIYYRTHGWCGLITDDQAPEDVPESNRYLHIAAAAKALAHPAGSETWAFKQLAGVYPSSMSSTLKKALKDRHSNYFTQYAGKNITQNGQTRAGEWIDTIRGRDWLQNDMQLRLFNLLLTNQKIPYTNSGIALVQNEMIASLAAAQDRGVVAGDEYDADGNLVRGFTTSVPNARSITATQKASRILHDCKFSARLAGAIHVMTVNGNLTY